MTFPDALVDLNERNSASIPYQASAGDRQRRRASSAASEIQARRALTPPPRDRGGDCRSGQRRWPRAPRRCRSRERDRGAEGCRREAHFFFDARDSKKKRSEEGKKKLIDPTTSSFSFLLLPRAEKKRTRFSFFQHQNTSRLLNDAAALWRCPRRAGVQPLVLQRQRLQRRARPRSHVVGAEEFARGDDAQRLRRPRRVQLPALRGRVALGAGAVRGRRAVVRAQGPRGRRVQGDV